MGEVVGVASEHDPVAGTQRGANVMYAFELDGVRVAHLGDLGQSILRGEQAAALGQVDLLFVPVGDGPTIGASLAYEIAATLGARWVVPMHYRTAPHELPRDRGRVPGALPAGLAAGRGFSLGRGRGGRRRPGRPLGTRWRRPSASACPSDFDATGGIDGESDLHGQGERDRRARAAATA